ncbi:hypothetical protein MRX96_010313 [Rhipicephalus microplus]
MAYCRLLSHDASPQLVRRVWERARFQRRIKEARCARDGYSLSLARLGFERLGRGRFSGWIYRRTRFARRGCAAALHGVIAPPPPSRFHCFETRLRARPALQRNALKLAGVIAQC